MDAFALRNKVVEDYDKYIQSFLKILDPQIDEFVKAKLLDGILWPDPLIQLSPAYEPAETVAELAKQGVVHPLCSAIFQSGGRPLKLHRHQRTALDIAAKGLNYVVTTGTGSGKSLTYLLPIVNHVLQNKPEEGKVRAIIVYPMNALINSQEQALTRFFENLGTAPAPVRFARYTGQESKAEKKLIQDDPPHILLTNYVMLELMLTRPAERPFVEAASTALQFLVLDELHTYRGRQGADVALLVRRLRERSGNSSLQCIGTSATMSSGNTKRERAEAVAEVASKIFGVTVLADSVIDETLRWGFPQDKNPTALELKQALTAATYPKDWDSFTNNALSGWIEKTFGLRTESDGQLSRRTPVTLREGARELAKLTKLDEVKCVTDLQRYFTHGSQLTSPENSKGFAFKLHQFFSQGGSVYATIEPPTKRYFTLEGQHYAPDDVEKLLYPLVFCRECGQEYYLCTYNHKSTSITPRPPLASDTSSDLSEDGYLMVDTEDVWSNEQQDFLPETWFKQLKRGREPKPEYARYIPRNFQVLPNGSIEDKDTTQSVNSWFLPTPFLTCLRCGEVYTKRQASDYSKLSRLSSEGRSTATTLLATSSINQMRSIAGIEPSAQKLLSFTDNRQDASLQAGHFNDFVSVGLLRAALYKALQNAAAGLDHAEIAKRTVAALGLAEKDYAREVSEFETSPLAKRNRAALENVVEYRLYEDLRRGWRINQPNLEQCGLLILDYTGIEEACELSKLWQNHAILASAAPQTRQTVVRIILDYMRRELAISADCLEESKQDEMKRRMKDTLNDVWKIDENERLYRATSFVLPGSSRTDNQRSLGVNTALGRFIRSKDTWQIKDDLDQAQYIALIETLVEVLRKNGFLIGTRINNNEAFQLRSDCLVWKIGDGKSLARDPVRTRQMKLAYNKISQPNHFFADFYQNIATSLKGVEGREHTGQVKQEDREDREGRFRKGSLSVLFCSPTMELGIDIDTLNMVHMRNVPPTPANYAQRSGRAGRSGQAAFIATYSSVGSGHDQYFFKRPASMVSGVVTPPRLDLGNEELVLAHVQAIWLAVTGLSLKDSMIEVVDTTDSAGSYPLLPDVTNHITLSPTRLEECLEMCRRVLAEMEPELRRTAWYSENWLTGVVERAAERFDKACNRWRELYRTAERQLKEAREDLDKPFRSGSAKIDTNDAKRREIEAQRQKTLLCNTREAGESDFHPYRYFASEGFLPGYNFPRLPVQAYIPLKEEGTFLSRPRFLALSEFGPRNVVYHEGGKYRVVKVLLPAGDVSSRLLSAKLCHNCGYLHTENVQTLDICEHCGIELDANNSLTTNHLFEMTTVTTQRTERITSDEEERMRQGYVITTHFRFAPTERNLTASTTDNSGKEILELCYAPAATMWRINHRWRRSNTDGFTLNTKSGMWAKRPDEDDDTAFDADNSNLLKGVRLMVRDTRNILLLKLNDDYEEAVLTTMQHAFQRGIEAVFQVEEQELSSERIGDKDSRRILFWEAAEGGVGVLRRLVEDKDALAQVAKTALEICHFDPLSGADVPISSGKPGLDHQCGQACYRCLMTYSNQFDHALLSRHLIKTILLSLSGSNTVATVSNRGDAYFEELLAKTAKPFARKVLEFIESSGRKLPDAFSPVLEEASVSPDFYYKNGNICLFCDALAPSVEEKRPRLELEDLGYQIIEIRADLDLETQLQQLL